MAKPKIDPKLKSASESQIAGMVARMFGVVPTDTLSDVLIQIADTHGHLFPELRHDFNLYPWECPVPQYVMSDKINQLVEDLVGSEGRPFIVKDSSATGKMSLWVVRASFDDVIDGLPVDLPVRALINHFLIGDEWLRVTSFQLNTCLRKLKNQL